MMKKVNILAAITLILIVNVYPQEVDTSKCFPYKTGNMWEYNVIEGFSVVDTFQIFNIKDSVDENGIIHLTQLRRYINPVQSFYATYSIDTVNQFVYGYHINYDNALIYKLRATQGDQWVIHDNNAPPGGYRFEMARVNSVYQDFLFGESIRFMDIFYYLAIDSTDTTGLDRHGVTLANGFGLYFFGSFGFLRHYLRGAIIDSILYGDTTQIITAIENYHSLIIPENLELFQNYPNPFNPTTTINYQIKDAGLVTLKIYDILGKEVTELVNEAKESGKYSINFDASNLPSGVYIYSLRVNDFVQNHKMTLLK